MGSPSQPSPPATTTSVTPSGDDPSGDDEFDPSSNDSVNGKVRFDRISVHEHSYELGDNPSVSEGTPLTIAWERQHTSTYDVAYYEIYRPSSKRKSVNHLRLSTAERAKLLLFSGYTIDDIVHRSMIVSIDRQSRSASVKGKKWDGIHEAMESTSRTLKKVARRGSLLATAPVRRRRRASMATAATTATTTAGAYTGSKNHHHHRSRRRNSLLSGAKTGTTEDVPTTTNDTRRRRNSLMGSTTPTSIHPCTDNGGTKSDSQHSRSKHMARRRRNSLLGSTPAECGTKTDHHQDHSAAEQRTGRRRHSLLGSTGATTTTSSIGESHDHGGPRRWRRSSFIGDTPPDCVDHHETTTSTQEYHQADHVVTANKPARRRRNSLLGSSPSECNVGGGGGSSSKIGGPKRQARRNSIFGNKPVHDINNMNHNMESSTSGVMQSSKSRRRNSLFTSSSNRRASISAGKSIDDPYHQNASQTVSFGNSEPLTDMDACIVGPRSA